MHQNASGEYGEKNQKLSCIRIKNKFNEFLTSSKLFETICSSVGSNIKRARPPALYLWERETETERERERERERESEEMCVYV